MDSVMDCLLMGHHVPSLRLFAKKRIFSHVDEVMPNWTTRVFVENLHLQEKVRRLTADLEKHGSRLRRRRNRAVEAVHEMDYVSAKLLEIETAIYDQRYQYAAGELRCLRGLDSARKELQYWHNLCHVSLLISP